MTGFLLVGHAKAVTGRGMMTPKIDIVKRNWS
jgi:hypothetical protein